MQMLLWAALAVLGVLQIQTTAAGQTIPNGKEAADNGQRVQIDFAQPDWLLRAVPQNRGRWGLENLQVVKAPAGLPAALGDQCLRASYPARSASPSVQRNTGAPLGGGQFCATLGLTPCDELYLRYYVRFAKDFDFVKGGKLPGLFGGSVLSGKHIPDGTNGFSTRFMWRRRGDGEVYAYLPTSTEHGTSLGRGNWRFVPGQWQELLQRVKLNTPGQDDGLIQVWFDGRQVLESKGLRFRTVGSLKIEGLFFSTFFGGDDPSWATPHATAADFAGFQLSQHRLGGN